ncbi:DUF364 domain-containing protein [Xanthobacteraceae bacterium Astr-EGSB]|uniref:Rossmann-like domain-containing protein n=1 Tax=Astrobacterium formosum TaxID=3069710 RepID=UPI0027B691BA|nr:DUF364 domain-containing protein [Xanthobacteraceae bacterium Astr-EGSB]
MEFDHQADQPRRAAGPDEAASDTALIDVLCDRLLPLAGDHRVADLRIGLGYTGVLLDDGRCGLAYTFRDAVPERGCNVLDDAGTLAGRAAADLAPLAKSSDMIAAAVGLATLNALIEPPVGESSDVLELLTIRGEDEVGMVGHFRPLTAPLRAKAKALHVFERHADAAAGILAAEAARDVLPRCQVAIVTATSLLNRTMDTLLDLCRNAREVVILGPSTPLRPDVFAGRGVTCLSGVAVTDGPRALQILGEGGGTRRLQPALRKVNLRVEAAARRA